MYNSDDVRERQHLSTSLSRSLVYHVNLSDYLWLPSEEKTSIYNRKVTLRQLGWPCDFQTTHIDQEIRLFFGIFYPLGQSALSHDCREQTNSFIIYFSQTYRFSYLYTNSRLGLIQCHQTRICYPSGWGSHIRYSYVQDIGSYDRIYCNISSALHQVEMTMSSLADTSGAVTLFKALIENMHSPFFHMSISLFFYMFLALESSCYYYFQ